jgi:hypothetical protein
VGGMGNFNPKRKNDMIKIVNRKTGLVLKMDCCMAYFLHSCIEANINIDDDLALIDCRNNTIEFEGNDDSFLNVMKGKL